MFKNVYIHHRDYCEIVAFKANGKISGFIKIDTDDIPKARPYQWRISEQGYVLTTLSLQRLVLNSPKHIIIDHINRNRIDNRKSNLRYATHQENNLNRSPLKNSKSGIIGVRKVELKHGVKWHAYITPPGTDKQKNLGVFYTKDEAIEARKKAELKYFGKFSKYYNEQ